ncbi:hypothetical protein BX661DRAFT_183607 [Kickxella alabastrina]|uniref:uncharacterized protein n=1 Tax=Kickxella alabastrina TaxID=61397 RepID=UPI0022201AEF|nr:uncharacterized protein BX661DRAFT_183607 [Kickxella alabastrina]KAI7826845.1 hypothetical protein BX661DRAFT_183607 [Kickxella alabastrina]
MSGIYTAVQLFSTAASIGVMLSNAFMIIYSGMVFPKLSAAACATSQFISFTIGLVLMIMGLPGQKAGLNRFPAFKDPLTSMQIFAAWFASMGVFLISDPVFQSSRNNNDISLSASVYKIMFICSIICGVAFVANVGGYILYPKPVPAAPPPAEAAAPPPA